MLQPPPEDKFDALAAYCAQQRQSSPIESVPLESQGNPEFELSFERSLMLRKFTDDIHRIPDVETVRQLAIETMSLMLRKEQAFTFFLKNRF